MNINTSGNASDNTSGRGININSGGGAGATIAIPTAAPLDSLGRRPAMRSPPGAGWGGYRSLRFDSLRCLIGGGEHGKRSTEQLGGSGGSGGSRGASRGGESGAAATATCERRRGAARRGRRAGCRWA